MFRIKEVADVFVDACVRDETGQMLFLSCFGRDTSIQQLFAAFYLRVSEGGLEYFHLRKPSAESWEEGDLVRAGNADALQKLGLWAGPSLGTIGEAIAREPDPGVRHALVRACWSARRSSAIPRNVLAQLAASDPDQYVRNEAKSVLAFNER